jgi:predicted secreted protein
MSFHTGSLTTSVQSGRVAGSVARALAYGAALAAFSLTAGAQVPIPQGVVALNATASVEVDRDLLGVTLSTSRDGPDAAVVQTALKQALDAALAEARKVAQPGQLDVRAGNFSLSPRYTAKGGITGWQGTTEMVVEGRDMQAIAALTGRITTLTIARVGYSLSREQKEKAEADLTAEAIGRYRAKAGEYARQFGYGGYEIREVNVSADMPGPIVPMMARAKVASAGFDEALPVEAGKATVTVQVNGSVTMKR